jgi:arylformamidase
MRRNVLRRFGLLAALALLRPAQAGPLRDMLRERREQRDGAEGKDSAAAGPAPDKSALPAGATVEADVAYGDHAAHRLDVYRPARAEGAPLLFMVHGGGWRNGDKANPRSIRNKVSRWVARGWVVVSINYRLLPEAQPVEQAEDVAKALAFAQRSARSWGADPTRVLVMGHSAGAHLVSLLTSDPAIIARHGGQPWLGTVSLDSAAFDVVEIMNGRHLGLYDTAFKADPAYWRLASPIHRLTGKPVASMLAVCSSKRSDSCPQAKAYAAKAGTLGGRVTVMPIDMTHGEINEQLGLANAYTESIEAFMRSVGLP